MRQPLLAIGVVFVCGAAVGAAPRTVSQGPHLVRSLSGPSGKVVGSDFILDEVRTRFVYPQDRTLTVYFEWEWPAGDHVLTATWSRPDGRVASVSPERQDPVLFNSADGLLAV